MTINILLAVLMSIGLAVAIRRHGASSLMTLGVIGLIAYSLPVLLDFHSPFTLAGSKRMWIETPVDTDFAVLVAWFAFLPTIAMRWSNRLRSADPSETDRRHIRDLGIAGVIIIVAGHAYLSWEGGILYFAQAREAQAETYLTLIWKWSIPLTLALSVVSRSKYQQAIVLFGVMLLFLRGDRTMLAISLFAGILSYREIGGRGRDLLSPKKLGLILAASILLLVGKPIYLTLKQYLLTGTYVPVQAQSFSMALAGFEPVGTLYHLTFVIQNQIHIPFTDFFVSVFGNFLIIPSIFGINTNLYGETVTSFVGPGLKYGIAGSYLAHGYSVGGLVGVGFFAALYGIALAFGDRLIWRSQALSKALFIVIGSTLAGYTHRNGLDNFGSFIRQALVMAAIMLAVAWAVRVIRGRDAKGLPAHATMGVGH